MGERDGEDDGGEGDGGEGEGSAKVSVSVRLSV